jgi:PKD domain-containing protein/Big-like domain-containing protein
MKVPYVQMIMNGRRQAAQGRFLKGGAIRRCLTLGLAAGLLLAMVSSAQAAALGAAVDQQQILGSSISFSARGPMAQTFTAGLNNPTFTAGMRGNLDHVSLELYNPYGTVTVSIHTVSANQPTNTQIGPTSSAGYLPCCMRWTDFSFSTPIPITSGTQYAIVVVPGGAPLTWYQISGTSTYPSGKMWLGSGGTWYGQSFETTFKTWVATAAANSAPTIKANLDTVQVTEGAVPTASGTYSDPDGDTVTLSASALAGSAGTVTGAAGTWTWTGAAADEGQGQAITITADDGNGNKATAQFSTVIGSLPPVPKISGAPASAREGTTISLTASATSASAEDTAAGFTYKWSVTEYGNALPGGSGASYSFKTDDEGVYVVTLTATDDGGFSGTTAPLTITGVDSAPVASITSVPQGFVIVPQQSLSFTGTFTDAGSVVDTSYTTTWSWGDGSPNSSGNSATHVYASGGTYTVTLTAADDDGVAGSAATTVTVLTPAAALAKLTAFVAGRTGLNKGQMDSLLAKLNAADDSRQRGDTGAACNQLNAFVNEVDADQKAGRISSGDAGTMTDTARLTQRSMGCFRTLVEFLSGL